MSVSELFDHGAPHPWANLRVNNLSVDGTFAFPSQTGTLMVTFSGAIPATVFPIQYQKIGTQVTLQLAVHSSVAGGIAGNITSPASSIPAFLVPTFPGTNTELDFTLRVNDNGVPQLDPGFLQINSNGSVIIFKENTGALGFGVIGADRGMLPTAVSYITAT